jgi:ABC-type uncharacterized transport system permease subunit
MSETPKYKRVLLKVSGEALMGSRSYGLDVATLKAIAQDVSGVVELGVEVAMVMAAATSSAASPAPRPAWIAPRPTTWACWRPS